MLPLQPLPARPPSLAGPTRVLLAEDDEPLRGVLSEALRAEGYHVIDATHGPAPRDWGFEPPPDLVIADVRMSGGSGLEVLAWMKAHGRAVPVILITACDDSTLHQEAEPLDVDDLVCAATLLAEPR